VNDILDAGKTERVTGLQRLGQPYPYSLRPRIRDDAPCVVRLGERLGLVPSNGFLLELYWIFIGVPCSLKISAEGALQIARVAGRHVVQAAAVDHDQRRIGCHPDGVGASWGEAVRSWAAFAF